MKLVMVTTLIVTATFVLPRQSFAQG